jgi:hypothetical protein
MKGDRKRMTTTITVDPVEWANFQENVKKFLLDPSASEHLGTLIRNENARFNGQEGTTNPEVDEATMQRELRTLNGKYVEIQQLLEKKGVWNRLVGLANDYNLSSSNGEDVIGKLLHGIDREGTLVQRYVNNQGSESEVLLLINLIQVRDEMAVTRQKLKEVMKKRYEDIMPLPEEAAGAASMDTKKTTCCLECGHWLAEEAKKVSANNLPGGVKCAAGRLVLRSGKETACDEAIPKSVELTREEPNPRGCQGRPGCPAEPHWSVFNGEDERLIMCGKCSNRHTELLMQFRGEEKRAEKALAQLRSETTEGKADEPPQEECVEQDEDATEEETEEDTDEEDSYDQDEWVYSEE